MIEYHVWLVVERHDTKTDKYEDMDLPHAAVTTYEGRGALAKAERLADQLQYVGEALVAKEEQ